MFRLDTRVLSAGASRQFDILLEEAGYFTSNQIGLLFLDTETTRFKAQSPLPFHKENTLVLLCAQFVEGHRNRDRWEFDSDSKDMSVFKGDEAAGMSVLPGQFLIGHNMSGFDLHWLRSATSIPDKELFSKLIYNTDIAEYTITAQKAKGQSMKLGDIAEKRRVGVKFDYIEEEYWSKGIDTDEVPLKQLREYCINDVMITMKVFFAQLEEMAKIQEKHGKSIMPILYHRQRSAVATSEMTWNGINFNRQAAMDDIEVLTSKVGPYASRLQKIHEELMPPEYAAELGEDVTNTSPKQVAVCLFGGEFKRTIDQPVLDENGIPIRYKGGLRAGEIRTKKAQVTKTFDNRVARIIGKKKCETVFGTGKGKAIKYSVNEENLTILKETLQDERSKPKHEESGPLFDKLIEYVDLLVLLRGFDKMVSTYLVGYSKFYNEHDGKIHPNFNQTIARTSRLSSSNPNLQNLPDPRKNVEGVGIRDKFYSDPCTVFVEIDFSGMELHGLAICSGDENLTQQLLDYAAGTGPDLHSILAAQAFGVPIDKVTKDQRALAKTVRFATLYGGMAPSIARRTRIEQSVIQNIINAMHTLYPGVERLVEETTARVKNPDMWESYDVITYDEEGNVTENRKQVVSTIQSESGRLYAFPQTVSPNGRAYFRPTQIRNHPIQGFSTGDIVPIAIANLFDHIKNHPAHEHTRMLATVHDSVLLQIPDDHNFVTTVQDLCDCLSFCVHDVEKLLGREIPFSYFPVEAKYGYNWNDMAEIK